MMMKNELKRLARGELIGSHIQVVEAKNPSLKGKRGMVIDETKNMLVIQSDDAARTNIIKEQVTLKINDETIRGELLCERPEERIKLTSKKLNRTIRSVENNAREKKNKESRNEDRRA